MSSRKFSSLGVLPQCAFFYDFANPLSSFVSMGPGCQLLPYDTDHALSWSKQPQTNTIEEVLDQMLKQERETNCYFRYSIVCLKLSWLFVRSTDDFLLWAEWFESVHIEENVFDVKRVKTNFMEI